MLVHIGSRSAGWKMKKALEDAIPGMAGFGEKGPLGGRPLTKRIIPRPKESADVSKESAFPGGGTHGWRGLLAGRWEASQVGRRSENVVSWKMSVHQVMTVRQEKGK